MMWARGWGGAEGVSRHDVGQRVRGGRRGEAGMILRVRAGGGGWMMWIEP